MEIKGTFALTFWEFATRSSKAAVGSDLQKVPTNFEFNNHLRKIP